MAVGPSQMRVSPSQGLLSLPAWCDVLGVGFGVSGCLLVA
jgi:hypothetical protein